MTAPGYIQVRERMVRLFRSRAVEALVADQLEDAQAQLARIRKEG